MTFYIHDIHENVIIKWRSGYIFLNFNIFDHSFSKFAKLLVCLVTKVVVWLNIRCYNTNDFLFVGNIKIKVV